MRGYYEQFTIIKCVLSRSYCQKIDQELFIKETFMLAETLLQPPLRNRFFVTACEICKALRYIGLKIWNIVPSYIKKSKALPELTKIIN